MVLAKVAWTFAVFSAEGALHHLAPAAFGLLACNLALVLAWRRWRTS